MPDVKDDWTTPGAHRIADGIYRIPLPVLTTGVRTVNVYAVESGRSVVLIDGGWAHQAARQRLEHSLASVGHGMGDIDRFLITHVHQDHYSQALTVRREFGTRVSLGEGERESVALLRASCGEGARQNAAQLNTAGAPHLADAWSRTQREQHGDIVWESPDDWLQDEQRFRHGDHEIAAFATPGHTQGHVIFVDGDSGVLFSGDHLLSATTPVIGIEPATTPRPLADALDSLHKILRLPDHRLLPAHGPVMPSSHAVARQLLAHHDRRLAWCLETVGAREMSAYDVARAFPWTRHKKQLVDLDEISAVMATLQTRAYLEHLALSGALDRHVDAGVVSYSTASPVQPGSEQERDAHAGS